MKKQITINGVATIVSSVEELRALDLPITVSVEQYNALFDGDDIKKFSDKNAAAKRLFAVLPEYVAPAKDATKAVKTAKESTGVKSVLRRLFGDPKAAYTGAELEALTNATYKVLHDDLARLKHPTYAGKAGTLTIVRIGKLYVLEGSEKHAELVKALAA